MPPEKRYWIEFLLEPETDKPTTRSSKRLRDRKRKSPTPEKSPKSSDAESDQLSETRKSQTLDPEIFDSEDRLTESEDRLSDKVESSDESSKGFSIAFGKIDEEKMNQKENYVAKPKAINLKQKVKQKIREPVVGWKFLLYILTSAPSLSDKGLCKSVSKFH